MGVDKDTPLFYYVIKYKIYNIMPTSKYALKAGVLLQAFSDVSKTCTNANITDELAEWHLSHNPGCVIYFAVMPGKSDVPSGVRPAVARPTVIIPAEAYVESKTEVAPTIKKKVAVITKRKR